MASQALKISTAANYTLPLPGPGGADALGPGGLVWVTNTSGGNINVSPPTGGQIQGLAIGSPYVLRAGKTLCATHLAARAFAVFETV